MKEYVAGFLDADGSVTLHKATSKHSYQRRPCVSFFNADIDILKAIQREYGGNIKQTTFKEANRNDSFELILHTNNTLKLLEDVYPFMKHKKKKTRAGLILKYYKKYTPRNGRYTEDLIRKKQWLNDQVMSIIMRGAGAY